MTLNAIAALLHLPPLLPLFPPLPLPGTLPCRLTPVVPPSPFPPFLLCRLPAEDFFFAVLFSLPDAGRLVFSFVAIFMCLVFKTHKVCQRTPLFDGNAYASLRYSNGSRHTNNSIKTLMAHLGTWCQIYTYQWKDESKGTSVQVDFL